MRLTQDEFRAIQLRRSTQDFEHLLTVLATGDEVVVDIVAPEGDERFQVSDAALREATLFLQPPAVEAAAELSDDETAGEEGLAVVDGPDGPVAVKLEDEPEA